MFNNSLYGNFRNRKFTDIWDNAGDFVDDYEDSGVYATNNKISHDSATTLFYLLYGEYGNSIIASSDENQFKYQVFSTIYEYGPSWEKRIDVQNAIRNLTEAQLLTGESYSSQIDRTNSGNTSLNGNSSENNSGSTNNTTSGTSNSTNTKITNHAYNPGTSPANDADTPLTYINQQEYEKGQNNITNSGTDNTTTSNQLSSTMANIGSHSDTGRDTTQSSKTKGKIDAYMQLWELLDNDVTRDFITKFKKYFLQIVIQEKPLWYVTEVEEDEQ